MKRRRRTRHLRNVILSLSAVGLFLLCAVMFYDGLLDPALSNGAEPEHTVSVPDSESAAPSLTISSAAPVSQEESEPVSETASEPVVSAAPPAVSSSAPAVSSEAPHASSQPVPVSSQPQSEPAPPESTPPVSVPENDPYPALYVSKPEYVPHEAGDKVVYLTFDDGPSNLTIPVLDVLDRYGIKATFFVVGKTSEEDKEALRETVERGHTLAVHTYTHDYASIYASPEAYLSDFSRIRNLIYDTTGVEPTIYRYAGGSVNGYNKGTARSIVTEMNRRGYTYYDWNVDSGDAQHGATAESIYRNVIDQTSRYEKAIVLMHNSGAKKDTLDQLPRIIEKLQSMGYRFAALDATVEPINFRLPN